MKNIGIKLTAIVLCVMVFGIAATVGTGLFVTGDVVIGESVEKANKSTQYEAERLDNWLSVQTTTISTIVDALSTMDDLVEILTAETYTPTILAPDEIGVTIRLEDHTVDMLRPFFKTVIDSNDAFFETYMGFEDGSAVAGSGYQFDYTWWAAPNRGWYKLALTDTKRAHVTSPYVDAQTGELCISIAQAVLDKGKVIGVMGSDVFVTELQRITLGATLDSTGFSMLIDSNGDILVHPDSNFAPDAEGNFNNLGTVNNNAYQDLWKKISASDGSYKFKDENGKKNYYISCTLETTGWSMVMVLPESVVLKPILSVVFLIIPIALAIMLLAGILTFFVIRSQISRPMGPLTAFFNKAGQTGDLTFTQEQTDFMNKYSRQKDEIGQLVDSASRFIQHVTYAGENLESVASGDLTADINLLSNNDTLGLSLKKMIDSLNQMFSEIHSVIDQVTGGSQHVSDGAQTLAQGSTEQAASIAELSNSIAEIAGKTKANAEIAEKTERLANTIMNSAEKGSRQMNEMIAAVGEITDASNSISKIIKTIDDIAFQTNILALNAAVEAARAGQHGKGFAVVAEEVRNLASKSAEAAKDTGSMIQNSVEKAALGARIAGETASSLTEIVSGINESSKLINDIAKSSDEQTDGIERINVGIDQVAQVVQQNSATAEESAAAAEEMNSLSNVLQGLIARFKLKR